MDGRAVNTIGQSNRGGGDRSSRLAQHQARENEQKALSLWIKGATFQQIAAAGFGIELYLCRQLGEVRRTGYPNLWRPKTLTLARTNRWHCPLGAHLS